MKIIKKKKNTSKRNPKKESIFKGLAEVLNQNGYKVRREKLKTGHGWRVVSGKCKHEETSYIFVDSVLGADEQIEFLAEKIKEFGMPIPPELVKELPVYLQ